MATGVTPPVAFFGAAVTKTSGPFFRTPLWGTNRQTCHQHRSGPSPFANVSQGRALKLCATHQNRQERRRGKPPVTSFTITNSNTA
ncbi:MAG: hypothetical protein WAK72_10550, partial [Pseudolabrys sp.]